MKRVTLLTAAAIALMATPAMAGGYVGLNYTDISESTDDAEAWQGEGAFGWSGGAWGGQVDGSLGNVEFDGGDLDIRSLTGHMYWSGGAWRIGGVVGTAAADPGSGGDIEETAYGVEGTYSVGDTWVIGGSALWGEAEALGFDIDTQHFEADIDFYGTPNFRIGGSFGMGEIDVVGIGFDTSAYGLDMEFRPWSAPVSFTLGFENVEIDDAGPFEADVDLISVGARWNFGGGTLRERDNATPFDTQTPFVQRVYGVK